MSAPAPAEGSVIDAENPWPGLSAFDEAAARYFSGRDAESAELLRLVGQGALTVLFGKSGLGKTSLLQAGLFPRLRRQNILPVHIRLDVRDRTAPLIEQAGLALRDEIHQHDVDAAGASPREGANLWERLHGRSVEWWSPRNQPLLPLFVFDQFEEVLTLGQENPEAVRRLWLDLADLIENRLPAGLAERIAGGAAAEELDLRAQRYKVLLSFREDFLPEIEGWKSELPSLMRNRLRLLPMSADQALRVVSGDGPAGRVHELVNQADTARAIVRFVAAVQVHDGAGRGGRERPVPERAWDALELEPALLSLVCAGLNARRKALGGRGSAGIDAALLADTGRSIIADFYRGCVADVPDVTRRFIEDALITENGFRNSYPLEDALGQGLVSELLLRRLVDRRLLRIDHQLGIERVELIHDRLTDVVREHRNRQRAERDRRRQRRQALASSGVAAFGVLVALVLWYLLSEAREQRVVAERALTKATAFKVAIESKNIFARSLPGGTPLGLKLALAAFRLAPGPEGFGALQTAERATDPQLWMRAVDGVAVAVSPDGRRVASGGLDGTVQLWDTASGARVGKPITGHTDAIKGLAFSPDSQRLVSGSMDRTLRLWDVATGAPRGGPLTGHTEAVLGVAFSPDGKRIVSASLDGTLRFWDVATRSSRPLSGQPGGFASVAFSPDGKRIVSGDAGHVLRLWDADSGKELGEPAAQQLGAEIVSVAFSPDGSRIVSGGYDSRVRLWDAATLTQLFDSGFRGHTDGVQSVAFSPDGKRVVSGSWDNTVRLWDATTGNPVGEPLKGHTDKVWSVAFSPDGQHIASLSSDGTLRWSSVVTGQPLVGHAGRVNGVAFSPDGGRVFSGGDDGTLRCWDVTTGQPIGAPMREGGASAIRSLALSPDGRRLATGSLDGTVLLRDVESGQVLSEQRAHEGEVSGLAFTRDGRRLASASWDGSVRLWDAATGQPVGALPVADSAVFGVAFNPDASRIVAGTWRGTVLLRAVANGEVVGVPNKEHSGVASSVAFSPDGRTIVSGSHDTTLRLRDGATGAARGAALKGHLRQVTSVAFSPDGRYIVSGAHDMTLRLWDAASGASIGEPFVGHEGAVYAVAFSRDGKRLVSASDDQTVRLWRLPPELAGEETAARLCAKLETNLSHAEWTRHLGNVPYVKQCPSLPVPHD